MNPFRLTKLGESHLLRGNSSRVSSIGRLDLGRGVLCPTSSGEPDQFRGCFGAERQGWELVHSAPCRAGATFLEDTDLGDFAVEQFPASSSVLQVDVQRQNWVLRI